MTCEEDDNPDGEKEEEDEVVEDAEMDDDDTMNISCISRVSLGMTSVSRRALVVLRRPLAAVRLLLLLIPLDTAAHNDPITCKALSRRVGGEVM